LNDCLQTRLSVMCYSRCCLIAPVLHTGLLCLVDLDLISHPLKLISRIVLIWMALHLCWLCVCETSDPIKVLMDCQEVDQRNSQLAVTARPEGQPVADGDNADPKGADAGADGGDRKPGAAEAPAQAAVTAPPPNIPPSKRAVEAAGQAAEEWSQPKKPRPVVVVPPPPPPVFC